MINKLHIPVSKHLFYIIMSCVYKNDTYSVTTLTNYISIAVGI